MYIVVLPPVIPDMWCRPVYVRRLVKMASMGGRIRVGYDEEFGFRIIWYTSGIENKFLHESARISPCHSCKLRFGESSFLRSVR